MIVKKTILSALLISVLLLSVLLSCFSATAALLPWRDNDQDEVKLLDFKELKETASHFRDWLVKARHGEATEEDLHQWKDSLKNLVNDERRLYMNINKTTIKEGENFTVSVADHTGDPVSDVKIIFNNLENDDNEHVTDANGEVKLTAPEVEENELYEIWATSFTLGSFYIPANQTVWVMNSDTKLNILLPKTTVSSGKTFDVVVINGENQTQDNVTVSFNDVNMSTDDEGKVSFKAPQVEHPRLWEITATKDGYEATSEHITVEPQEQGFLGLIMGNMVLIGVIVIIICVAVVAAWKYKQHFWY